ncbi:MAG: hypothetical protein ACJ0G1_08315 [Gammaproteobacteria bacterium]
MIRRTIVSTDFFVATGLICALFLGNAKFDGYPLVIVFSLFSLAFLPLYRPHIYRDLSVAIAAAIFLIYSIRANISYDATYSFWVLNFILGYFYITIANSRMRYAPHSFYPMLFRAALIALVIFFIGSSIDYYYSTGTRSSFIFGPNMLYRVLGCLSGVAAGYLFFDGRKVLGSILAILALSLLIMTGSRAGVFIMAALLLVWIHAHTKMLSIRKNTPVLLILIGLVVSIILQADIANMRSFGFSQFTLDDNARYTDGYMRWRPYLYFIFEPDRFSLIGINYDTFWKIFGSFDFLYPHNIFLELIMFYGFFGIFVSLYFIIKIYILIKYLVTTICTRAHILYYSIIISSIGILFSGDLGDSGVYIGVVMAMFQNVFVQHRKTIIT